MIKGTIGTVKTFENGVIRFNFEIPHEEAPDDSMRWAYKEAYLSLTPPDETINRNETWKQILDVLHRTMVMVEEKIMEESSRVL